MPEPKRLGEFSPEFIESERELIGQVRTERKSELSDYIAAERPQLKRPEGIPNELDLVRQVMAGRKKEAPVEPTGRTIGETLKDIPITVAKGVVGLGEAVVGLADIPTLGRVGKTMEEYLGYDPKTTQKFLGEYYSPAQKAAFAKVEKAKGFVGTIKAAIENPSTIGHSFIQTFPLMLGGAASARTLLGIGMKSPLLAGALGEGIISAGAAAEEARQQTKDGLLTPKQAALTAISGAGTAMFALAGGRVATKFGIIDPDVFLAGGSSVTSTGIVKRIIGGGISEGVFEELPQSMQEQVWLNAALDKPLLEGVPEAGATGMLTGMAMGAGFNVFTGKPYSPEDITPPTETAAKQERAEKEARKAEPVELTEAEKRQAAIDREFEARRTPEERQAEIEAAMPATPMTTISEETTRLAEEGIKPEAVEPVPEEIVPEKIPLAPEAMPAAMRALGMKPVPVEPIVEKPVVEKKIVEPEAPKIEIPTLTDTTQAIAFGEKATPEQITELKRLRKEAEARYDVLVKEDRLDEAGEEAFKAQLYREAFEAKEIPKEPKVEKPKVAEKELSTEIEKRGIKGNDLLDALDRIEEAKSYDKTIEIDKTGHVTLYHRTDKASAESITKSGYMTTKEPGLFFGSKPEGQISGYGDTVIEVQIPIEKLELNDVFTDEVHFRLPEAMPKGKYKVEVIKKPAKPPTPKPPKPKLPEAVREEIEAEPIPEVAPKVEKKEKTGFVWIKGKQKPILSARKITKGKNKGKYEVILTKGRDEEGNIIPGAKKIVTEKHIITMPEEKIEVAPIEKAKVIKPVIPGVRPIVKKEEKIEVTPTPEGKEITVDLTKKEEAAVTPKQQKTYLLAEIDKAIEGSLKEAEVESIERARELLKMRINPLQQIDTVYKFEVPNDGTFEIVGSELFDFQKRVESAFPSTIISKKFKPKVPARKAVPVAKYKAIIGVVPEKLKPKDIDRIFEEVADTEARDITGAVLLNPFQNWLLSQDISDTVRDKIKSVAGKDYIEESRVKMETQDIEYARDMVEYREEELADIQRYYDGYNAGRITLKEINKETGIKRSGAQLRQDLQDAQSAREEAIEHLGSLVKEEEPLFLRRKTATAIGVSKAPALQSEMDKITLPWKNAPIVEVVQAQPELPDVILKASKGEIVDGVYYKGTVYIVADNMTSPEAAVKTLLHESFGHYGMRELLGKDFGDIMNKVYIAKRAEVVKIADAYGYDIKSVKDRALAADEWLAREAASNPESSWVQKVIATIRQFMRRIMPSLKLSNAEIQQLMEDAKTYVERGRPRARITEALFEEPGYQVRAYHGGPSMFERFRTARIGEGEGYQAIAWGLYFTDVKNIAKGYAERLALRGKTPKERYLYQVTLHKGKEPGEYDWLTWDKFITPETKDKVLKQLKKEFPDDAKLMVSWDISYGERGKGLTGQGLYQQLIQEIANTKNRKAGFEKFRPSDKEASLFLLRAGIDGVKYPAGTITGIKTKGFNYVVFDEEAVEIDERIAFAKRKPVPTKEEKMAEAFKVLGIKPKLKPEEPLPKRARSVGLAYQDISEEAKRLEVEMGLEYPKVTRTHAELREQADRIMGDQEQLIKTMEKEKNFTEAEGLVVRRAAATGLESLMKVVATKDVKKANEMHKTFKAGIGNKLQDLHSEYGRNLESLKEVVSPESIAKAFAGLERDLNKDDMDKFNSAAEALGQGDAKPMINFQKHLKATKQDPKLMDYVYEYWYNSILSGVPTHVVNVASNTAWGAWQVGVHKPLLAAIDPLVAKFQKRPTEYYMAEIIPALAGIKRGFKPGIKGAKEMLLKGYTTNADLDKFAADMGKSVGAFSRSPNKYLKAIAPFLTMPTRALRSMDIWAKQMNYEAELGSIAMRMEKKGEGKYKELLTNPNEDMMKEASEYADYTTFMGKLGKIGTQIEKLRTAVPGGRFIMPFVRTIANLVKRGVEMTPGVGAMKLLGGKVKGKEVTQVLVKQIEGAMIALVVASMFDDDEITGDVPANKAEREAFYRQGKKPWSIKIGDTWYQYRRIEPFNTPIAAVGILYDTWKRTGEEPSTEFVYRSAAGFVNNIIDSSYLSGLTQVLDSVRKADKWPQKLTNMFDRTIASFSPMSSFQRSFVRAIEAIDKEGAILRKPKGAIETLAAATPFISEMIPARKDVWGKEVVIPGSPLAQWLPWKAAKATRDVVEKEIERLHELGLISYPGMPAKYMSVAGKRLDLDDEQYDKLITESGQASKKKLDSLVGTSYWKMLSDKEKASRVQRIIKSDRKKARNVIKRELGIGAVPGMVPWKTTKKRKRPAWQEPTLGKKPGWQKSIGF